MTFMKQVQIFKNLLLLILLASQGTSLAGNRYLAQEMRNEFTPERQQQGPRAARLSEDEAVALVRQRVDGKVLAVSSIERGNALFYRVKILTREAAVRVFLVNANTGNVREAR
jgi:uncharacterized membrane protein YkoI